MTDGDRVKAKRRAKKPPLTDAERHKRFTDIAKETNANEDPDAFDRAFASVVTTPKATSRK